MSNLVLEAVGVELHGRPLFEPVQLSVGAGEVCSVTGPSGCGKSSLLAYLCGILPAPLHGCGHVRLGERTLDGLPPEVRRLGLMFQDPLLFPHLSVADNLGFGLRPQPGDRRRRQQVIGDALASVGLAGHASRDPATLSGGERTRVALLRMLLAEPQAILLDEPFTGLDEATRHDTRTLVLEAVRQRGVPAVLVTHDPADVLAARGPEYRLRPMRGPTRV